MIGVSIDKLKLIILLVSIVSLAACIPNPEKVKDLIELQEHQKIVDKYKTVLKEACAADASKLKLIEIYGFKESEYLIELSCSGSKDEYLWIEQLMKFQNLLKRDGLTYYQIQVSINGDYPYSVEIGNLDSYEKALTLFKTNLEQIKNDQLSELMNHLNKNISSKSITDLFNFVSVKSYADYKLSNYCNYSSMLIEEDLVSFKIETTAGSWLIFSYKVKGTISLNSIDLVQK